MPSKWMYVVAVLIALDYAGLRAVESCSCALEHPQTQFCRSDFAVVARVKRQVKPDRNMNIIYRVIVRKVFKATEKARVALKHAKVYTPDDEGMCGRQLQLNQTYLLTGNVYHLRAHVNICNYAQLWKNVTPRQRKGFRLLYKQGCACKINTRFGRRSSDRAAKHTCLWNSAMTPDDCLSPYGICLSSRDGDCSWAKSSMLTKCLSKNQPSTSSMRNFFT